MQGFVCYRGCPLFPGTGVSNSSYGDRFISLLGTLLDRDLQEFGVTSRQWFLAVLFKICFSEPPTLKEASRMMGSSYRKVKQIALKLEERGLLRLEKD